MIKTGMFASINSDIRYDEQDYKRPFTKLFTNGILGINSTNLQVTADENMSIKIKPGYAMIDGYNLEVVGEDVPITIEDADGVYNRIDRIVLRLDYVNRKMQLKCLAGEPTENPVAPEKVRTDGTTYDLSLATISVEAGVTEITQVDITDHRYINAECGKIRLADEDMTFDTIALQYQAQWAEVLQQITDFGIPLMTETMVGGGKVDGDTITADDGVLSIGTQFTPTFIGEIKIIAMATAPTGWLICNGQSLSKTTYAELFAAIGYTYGGSGNEFMLPDLCGRVVAGLGTTANFDTIGKKVGEETHKLSINEMPSHGHIISVNKSENSSFSGSGTGITVNSGRQVAAMSGVATASSTGGDAPHNNIQPTITMNYIIYTGVE